MLPVHTQSTQVEYGDADRRFLQEGNQLAQEESKETVGKGPAHRQELHNNTHTFTNMHTHLQVRVTAHAGGVLSVALWDILVTVITATLTLPTETPNTHTHCSRRRFLQLQVRLETTYPVLGVQLSEPYLVDMNWNVNCDVYQVSQGQTGYQSIGSIPHAFILVDNPEQGAISNDPHS